MALYWINVTFGVTACEGGIPARYVGPFGSCVRGSNVWRLVVTLEEFCKTVLRFE